jgi:Skp family chaperone for outer membrane proteins
VKKAVVAAGMILALGVFWYAGPSSGQTPNNPSPAASSASSTAGTRIAILNLTYVIKKYAKYQHFMEEMKGIAEPFTKKQSELEQKMVDLRKQAANLPRQAQQSPQGEELEKQAREIQRQMEDLKTEFQLKLGKRNDEEMKIIYLDIYGAVQGYATSHRFDLVLHYNDAITKEDFLGHQNIARKLNTGALMPLISAPNLDISQDIVDVLNAGMGAPNGATQQTQPVEAQQPR